MDAKQHPPTPANDDIDSNCEQLETKDYQSSSSGELEVRCPSCHVSMNVAVDTHFTDLICESCGSQFSLIDQGQVTRLAPPLSQLGRFELIERIGVGGFGSVWKARDKELDRTVAIKIPRQGGMTADEQEKFFREARAAAQLRHPRIVSVHEVGRDGDSVYIVSDFIRGVTLGDWLTGQQLTSREAAELCAKIAEALEHAHERGIVHRDLKPANIIIDRDGEPHLTDFGLARRDVGEVTVTIDGQIVGTPAYMSPEQAEGKAHAADRRSDVYSLGVILFQLLTGELPFRGNARMIMHQVIHDEPPSPRKLNANVAKDLETVTLRCLEKDPSRRYQSARDMGAELRRFLAGEPILARPIGRVERSWRWVKRNPRVAVLTASVVVLLVTIAALSTVGFAIAKRQQIAAQESAARETRLRQQAQNSAARAEQNLGLAEQAVDSYLTRFTEDPRFKQGDFNRLRTELLETAVPFYEQFAKQKPGDAKSEANQANAYARLASIHGETGKPDLSAKEYEQAIAIQKELVSKHPDNPGYRRDLGEQYMLLGWNLHIVGRYDQAQPNYEEALAVLSKLVENSPEMPEYRHLLARTHMMLGMLLRYSDLKRALENFHTAINLEDQLLAATPNVTDYESTLARSYFYLGHSLISDDLKRAREILTKAVDIQRKVAADYPKEPEHRAALAESVGHLGTVLYALGEKQAARRHCEEGIEIVEEVVNEFPSVLKYRVILGGIHDSYTNSLETSGDLRGALRQAELFSVVRDKTATDFPDIVLHTRYAARCHEKCATLAVELGDIEKATKHIDLANAIYSRLGAAATENGHYQILFPEVLNGAAWGLATSPFAERRNGEHAVKLATKACELTNYENGSVIDTLAAAYAETGDFDAAVNWSTKAIDTLDKRINETQNSNNDLGRSTSATDESIVRLIALRKEFSTALESYKSKKTIYQSKQPVDRQSKETEQPIHVESAESSTHSTSTDAIDAQD